MYEYEEGLPADALARYNAKLNLIGLEKCPYKIPADEWKNNPKSWPDVQYNDVYSYLIKFPRLYSRDAMENWRSLDAHIFFVSGWVQTVLHLKSSSGHFILRADVYSAKIETSLFLDGIKPSWRVTEDPHHPWLALSRDGPVAAAHCDCMAGLGETCSHIGAMLFKIEAAVRLGYTAAACTDVPCQWNQCFVKNVQPVPISRIKFYKQESRNRLAKTKKTPKSAITPATEAEQDQLLSALANTGENIVGLSVFAKYSEQHISKKPMQPRVKLPPPMRALYKKSNEMLSDSEVQDLCLVTVGNIEIGELEARYMEEVTESQSSSAVWHEQRAGRITASVAQDLMRTDPTNPAPSLIKKVCVAQTKPLTVPAIVWGNNHEHDAFMLYCQYHSNITDTPPPCVPTGDMYMTRSDLLPHQECSVRKSGFVISFDKPFLGASPDGRVNCQCCGKGVLEIKCPFRYKETRMQDMLNDNSFCIDQQSQLKPSHKYYAQIQLQMYVCGVSYGDMFIWTPLDCLITRVARDNGYIFDMIQKLQTVWTTAILPELLTRKLEGGIIKENIRPTAPSISAGRAYCKCRTTTDFEDMVGCDRCDEWYHRVCLKLKRLPKAKTWYCPPCRKALKKVNV